MMREDMAGLPGKAKPVNEICGLGGQLLVLLLQDSAHYSQKNKIKSSSSPTITSRAQSTISVCVVLVLLTLLLFALSTFDSDSPSFVESHRKMGLARRWLSEKKGYKGKTKVGTTATPSTSTTTTKNTSFFALQGMGVLFRRGSRGMTDLLVAHLTEEVRPPELRLFLRTLHRSSVTARADVVLIYSNLSSQFRSVIEEENRSFAGLLRLNDSSFAPSDTQLSPFDAALFRRRHNGSETIWGRGSGAAGGGRKMEENSGYSWGSILGFEPDELDPEDALAGFFDGEVPMQLRRWACYQMLLGRLRHSLRHVMLVGVNDRLVVGDAFARVRSKKAGESVAVADSVVLGGARAVRRLSDAMLVEIARVSIQRKNKKPQADDQILAHMMKNDNSIVRKKVKVAKFIDLLPDNTVIPSSSLNRSFTTNLHGEICSSLVDSSHVYRDC